MLIEAGVNPDSRSLQGTTPLFEVAHDGLANVVKLLLRTEANPSLATTNHASGVPLVALDIAAKKGHSAVVCDLVRQVGIEGCGGASRGADAPCHASVNWHVDVMTALTEAGVVDSGRALVHAVAGGCEAAVKFLLQKEGTSSGKSVYVNCRDSCYGTSPLLVATGHLGFSSPSPRIVRLLVDAGSDTASAVRITDL